jgi:hypothetical protein
MGVAVAWFNTSQKRYSALDAQCTPQAASEKREEEDRLHHNI